MQVSRYEAPESVDAAVALLANDNEARVIAGGTDLLVQMRTGSGAPSAFIDIKRIPEMSRLEIDSSGLFIGAAGMGLVVRVARNRYFPPPAIRALARMGETLAADGRFTATAFRDRSGIGRNLVIQVLEYFDRVRFTLREADRRRILLPSSSVFGADDND